MSIAPLTQPVSATNSLTDVRVPHLRVVPDATITNEARGFALYAGIDEALQDFMARRKDAVALDTMRSTFQELPHMSADAARGAGELIAPYTPLVFEIELLATRH